MPRRSEQRPRSADMLRLPHRNLHLLQRDLQRHSMHRMRSRHVPTRVGQPLLHPVPQRILPRPHRTSLLPALYSGHLCQWLHHMHRLPLNTAPTSAASSCDACTTGTYALKTSPTCLESNTQHRTFAPSPRTSATACRDTGAASAMTADYVFCRTNCTAPETPPATGKRRGAWRQMRRRA